MVPCEFRCWGQYLSWQFTIGLCATLARSRNERPDTFACFLWPAQYRMGRAYSLQKLNGRVVAGGFAVGKTPALSARRNRRMPVKEQGFSLLEVLIAMAISSVLLLGAARFLPALQRESLTSTRKLRWKMKSGCGYLPSRSISRGRVIVMAAVPAKGWKLSDRVTVSLCSGMRTVTVSGIANR